MKKLVAAYALVLPTLAFADIQSGLSAAIPWAQGIGLAASTLGLIFAGIKFTSADPTAKETAKSVFVGAMLIAGAVGIMTLVKGWFA